MADQVEVVAVELLDHLASGTCVCDQAKACGLCLLSVVENNDYAKAHAAWTAASVSLGIANFGPDVSLGMAAARFAVTTTGRSGRRHKESFASKQLTGPFHRHDGYGADGRPRCWCGSIAERDQASGDLVCALACVNLDVADHGAVMQSGRITEAVDDVALAVESAWRRFVAAEPASEPGELGLPAQSSRGDALAAPPDTGPAPRRVRRRRDTSRSSVPLAHGRPRRELLAPRRRRRPRRHHRVSMRRAPHRRRRRSGAGRDYLRSQRRSDLGARLPARRCQRRLRGHHRVCLRRAYQRRQRRQRASLLRALTQRRPHHLRPQRGGDLEPRTAEQRNRG